MRKRTKSKLANKSSVNLRGTLLTLMSNRNYRPMKFGKLARELNVHGRHKDLLSNSLQELINEGVIVNLHRRGYVLTEGTNLFSGTISFLKSGAAFVNDLENGKEIFIKGGDTN